MKRIPPGSVGLLEFLAGHGDAGFGVQREGRPRILKHGGHGATEGTEGERDRGVGIRVRCFQCFRWGYHDTLRDNLRDTLRALCRSVSSVFPVFPGFLGFPGFLVAHSLFLHALRNLRPPQGTQSRRSAGQLPHGKTGVWADGGPTQASWRPRAPGAYDHRGSCEVPRAGLRRFKSRGGSCEDRSVGRVRRAESGCLPGAGPLALGARP